MRANRVRERDAARKRNRGLLLHAAHGGSAQRVGAARRSVATRAATFERERQGELTRTRAKRDA